MKGIARKNLIRIKKERKEKYLKERDVKILAGESVSDTASETDDPNPIPFKERLTKIGKYIYK